MAEPVGRADDDVRVEAGPDDQGITGWTADEIQTGVALMTEFGQFGAGGRALYDPRLGERSLWDWSGDSPCRPRAGSPSRPARGTLEGAASPTSSRPAARTSSGSTRTPRSSGSPASGWNSGAPRRGHRRRGRRPRLPRPCGTYQPSRPEGRGGGHRGSGHGSRAMAHPASITQDAPTSATRSGGRGPACRILAQLVKPAKSATLRWPDCLPFRPRGRRGLHGLGRCACRIPGIR